MDIMKLQDWAVSGRTGLWVPLLQAGWPWHYCILSKPGFLEGLHTSISSHSTLSLSLTYFRARSIWCCIELQSYPPFIRDGMEPMTPHAAAFFGSFTSHHQENLPVQWRDVKRIFLALLALMSFLNVSMLQNALIYPDLKKKKKKGFHLLFLIVFFPFFFFFPFQFADDRNMQICFSAAEGGLSFTSVHSMKISLLFL